MRERQRERERERESERESETETERERERAREIESESERERGERKGEKRKERNNKNGFHELSECLIERPSFIGASPSLSPHSQNRNDNFWSTQSAHAIVERECLSVCHLLSYTQYGFVQTSRQRRSSDDRRDLSARILRDNYLVLRV